MKILLTRESVAMGDDDDAPHHREIAIADGTDLQAVVKAILHSRYLAVIGGGKATWTVVSHIPVAIVAQQWAEPKMLMPIPSLSSLDFSDNVLSIHFNYRTQQDPDVVYEEFQRVHARKPYQ